MTDLDGYYSKHNSMATKNSSKYEILQYFERDDFSLFVNEALNEYINTLYEPAQKAKELFNEIRPDAPVVSWINRSQFDAGLLAPGEEPPMVKLQFSKRHSTLFKLGLQMQFPTEVLEDVNIDIIGMHLAAAVSAIARRKDQYLINLAVNGVANNTANQKGTVYPSHVLNALDGDFVSNSNASASGTLTYDKMLMALEIGEEEGMGYTHMALHPLQALTLNNMLQFQSSGVWNAGLPTKYGDQINTPNTLAAIGFPDVTPVVTSAMPKDTALFVHKPTYGAIFTRRPLTISQEIDGILDLKKFGLHERFGGAVFDPNSATKITGLTYLNPTNFMA